MSAKRKPAGGQSGGLGSSCCLMQPSSQFLWCSDFGLCLSSVTLAPFTANLWRYLVYVPMHTELKDNVPDFRLCVRSITLDPFSHFIYWRMNWHLEHHMFAAVPCYNLRRLYKTLASDMPRPRTLVGSWREMRETWKRQKKDPDYQFETPLPAREAEKRRRRTRSNPRLATWTRGSQNSP